MEPRNRSDVMKNDPRNTAAKSNIETLSQNEIDAVSGGSFSLARPGQMDANWMNRTTGPLKDGYVRA